MASTSVPNATVEARATSDCSDCGVPFLFGRFTETLVEFGRPLQWRDVAPAAGSSPSDAVAHAAGQP